MNKKITAALLAAISATTISSGVMAEDGGIKVVVNNENISFAENAPFIENDHTLVPMREIFEALGASVDWYGETRTVVSYDPVSDVSITLQIDSDKMFVGETEVILETPARIVGTSTFVPVRAIAEGMNSVVGWDGETKTVIVEKELAKEPTEVENPWIDYKTLDELNAAINEAGDVKYAVADLTTEGCTVSAYRYMPTSNLAEIQYAYKNDKDEAEVTVRTMPGDTDISGISGGTKAEEYKVEDSAVEIYTYEDYTYAVWSCEDITVYSHCVAVKSATMTADDAKALVKTLVDDVAKNHPKG